MAVPKNIKRRAGHLACLREMTDQITPFMPLLAIFHAPHFKVHFSVAGSKSFQSKIEKYKVSIVGNNLIYNDMISGKIT